MEQRAQRRRLVADAIQGGNAPQAVCAHFGVAIYLVIRACKEHGVKMPPRRAPSKRYCGKTLHILARLLTPQPAETFATIARDLQIRRQRVDQVFREAIKVGFTMDRWQQPVKQGSTRTVKDD